MKLYEIANDYAALSNSDMDAETIADTLEGIQGTFEDKAEQVMAVIKNEQALEDALKAEAKALTARATSSANKVKHLKAYLASSINTMELKSVTAGVHKLSTRKGSQSVEIVDVDSLPVEFVEYVTTTKADKNLIKEKLKLGETVEGAKLVTGKPTLMIK